MRGIGGRALLSWEIITKNTIHCHPVWNAGKAVREFKECEPASSRLEIPLKILTFLLMTKNTEGVKMQVLLNPQPKTPNSQ